MPSNFDREKAQAHLRWAHECKYDSLVSLLMAALALHDEHERMKAELAGIDAVMARRPALDKPTRRENIEHAITTAGRATDTVTRLERELERLKAAHATLLRLARTHARNRHDVYFVVRSLAERDGDAPHVAPFETCPHRDCVLVRAEDSRDHPPATGVDWGTPGNDFTVWSPASQPVTCVCGHSEAHHESVEYRGDKTRHCLTDGCLCRNFMPSASQPVTVCDIGSHGEEHHKSTQDAGGYTVWSCDYQGCICGFYSPTTIIPSLSREAKEEALRLAAWAGFVGVTLAGDIYPFCTIREGAAYESARSAFHHAIAARRLLDLDPEAG